MLQFAPQTLPATVVSRRERERDTNWVLISGSRIDSVPTVAMNMCSLFGHNTMFERR